MTDKSEDLLERCARDLKHIRSMLQDLSFAQREAESEVPEKMRRFVMYFHDIHDVVNMYKELGHVVPDYLNRELERCDDRFRHLLEDLHLDGGAFEKVRREMAERSGNRWDHTRLLGVSNETRNGQQLDGRPEGRADLKGDQPGSGGVDRDPGSPDED